MEASCDFTMQNSAEFSKVLFPEFEALNLGRVLPGNHFSEIGNFEPGDVRRFRSSEFSFLVGCLIAMMHRFKLRVQVSR